MSELQSNQEQVTGQSSANVSQIVSQMGGIPENRDNAGKFLPGVSGNPGGRPKTAHIREAMMQRLATDGAAIVADVPFEIATKTGAKDSDRLTAVEIIRDTVEGKPIQAHMVAMAVDPNAVNTIAALAAKLLGDT